MDKKTTATKAWVAGLVSALTSGLLPILERWLMVDLPVEVETAIVAAATGAVTGALTYWIPNKPKEN